MNWSFLHEVGRKAIHLTILVVLFLFFRIKDVYGHDTALLFLAGLLVFFLIMEYLRLEHNFRWPFFQQFIRPREEDRMYGVVFFLAATVICLAVFDTPIAMAALLMITFGDMTAALVGKRWGTALLFRNKTAIGFVAELAVNIIVAIAIAIFFEINIYIPLVMAFVATIVETLIDELDDNLAVPLISGFVGQILLIFV